MKKYIFVYFDISAKSDAYVSEQKRGKIYVSRLFKERISVRIINFERVIRSKDR